MHASTSAAELGSGGGSNGRVRSLAREREAKAWVQGEQGGDFSDEVPQIREEVVKRRQRKIFWERFEQAFFVGLLLTLICFTVHVIYTEYSTQSVLAAEGPIAVEAIEPVPALEPIHGVGRVETTWKEETAMGAAVDPMLDEEEYPVVDDSFSLEARWINRGIGKQDAWALSPYVRADEGDIEEDGGVKDLALG